ncbi:LOW QUALITY PROTEIN: hypothetical protein U9M48_012072 [Paspalum notatum var. saurae]|uniref:Uncharacterized protein n=1 Tax=Paspalum notatum var. saurae TaxID=547442 RepID=A0AAQ3WI62_PASNO
MHRAAFVVDIEHYCISGHKNHQVCIKSSWTCSTERHQAGTTEPGRQAAGNSSEEAKRGATGARQWPGGYIGAAARPLDVPRPPRTWSESHRRWLTARWVRAHVAVAGSYGSGDSSQGERSEGAVGINSFPAVVASFMQGDTVSKQIDGCCKLTRSSFNFVLSLINISGDVDKHGYSNGPDSSSFTVQVEGHVDVGTLCDRLKKKASSVKIEAVIPGDLKAKMARQEQELSSLKKQNEELKDSAGEEKRRLRTELGSAEEEKRKLHRRIKDLESSNSQLEVQIRSRRIDVVTIHEEEVHAKLRISEDSRRRIK